MIRHTLKDAWIYYLFDTSVYLALSQNPGRIAEKILPRDEIVVIDEILRPPDLLNEVHIKPGQPQGKLILRPDYPEN